MRSAHTTSSERCSATVAVLGGGQLAAMMADAGRRLGVKLRVMDPAADAPAARAATHVQAPWHDRAALRALACGVECATLETENVPPATLRFLAACGAATRPGVASLLATGDRLRERRLLQRLGIPIAEFRPAASAVGLRRAFELLGRDVIAKTRTLGYDGRGQLRLCDAAAVEGAWERLGIRPLIVERTVSFQRELSLVSVRSLSGDIVHYPIVENTHADGVLRLTRAPAAHVCGRLQAQAEAWSTQLMEALDHVGVFTIELFHTTDGLIVNELAPRVHNSGHWTLDAAECSQFENHLRAILGLELGATEPRAHASMINLIGTVPDLDAVRRFHPDARLYLYGKQPRPRRKLGHITLVDADPARLSLRTIELRDAIAAGTVAVEAGVYDLASGRVRLIDRQPS